MSEFTYSLDVPGTSLRVSVAESTDPRAWEPLDRCEGDSYGVYRSIELYLSDTTTEAFAVSFCDASAADGGDEVNFQADPDRGEWDGPADLLAAAKANSKAIYWTVFEVLIQLGAALMPGATKAIKQQKKGGVIMLTENQRQAKANILRAVTRFGNKIGYSLTNRRVKWHVIDSLSSETAKPFPESLEEVLAGRGLEPCGYRVVFDAALDPSEIWLLCDERCVMWTAAP